MLVTAPASVPYSGLPEERRKEVSVPEAHPAAGSGAGPAVREPEPPAAPGPAAGEDLPPPEALRSFHLLQSLPLEALSRLTRALRPLRHAAGERILAQGERAGRMHFLRSGRVRVEIRTAEEDRVAVATLGPGDCFGEMSLLTGEPASADVLAEEDSESLGLDRSAFNLLAAENPSLLRDFTTLVSRRLRSADEGLCRWIKGQRILARSLNPNPTPSPEADQDYE